VSFATSISALFSLSPGRATTGLPFRLLGLNAFRRAVAGLVIGLLLSTFSFLDAHKFPPFGPGPRTTCYSLWSVIPHRTLFSSRLGSVRDSLRRFAYLPVPLFPGSLRLELSAGDPFGRSSLV